MSNYSFYAVPAAWMMALAPRGYSVSTYQTQTKTKTPAELRNPRSFKDQVAADPTISQIMRDRIVRAESASLNGIENLGFFAAAVVAGNVANVETGLLNKLAWGYVASRAVYNMIFINNDTNKYVFWRTGVFMLGIAINSALFILAGRSWNSNSNK